MTERELLKLALDAFGEIAWSNETQWQRDRAKEAITAIKEALAQPQQEAAPVAKNEGGRITWLIEDWPQNCLLYTHPPAPTAQPEQEPVALVYDPITESITPLQRTWVGLTDEEISELIRATHNTGSFVRAIEAKLKEKNT